MAAVGRTFDRTTDMLSAQQLADLALKVEQPADRTPPVITGDRVKIAGIAAQFRPMPDC